MNLPIDAIPNTNPPMFRWRQVIDTPVGKKTVEHEGLVLPSMEQALAALIGITKQLNQTLEQREEEVRCCMVKIMDLNKLVSTKPSVAATK